MAPSSLTFSADLLAALDTGTVSGFVTKYGLRLLPNLYEVFNPMPYEAARDMEVELAIGLRDAGYGVWQA